MFEQAESPDVSPDAPPELFPRPRHLGGFDDTIRAAGPVRTVHDPSLPDQGYTIRIDTGHVVLAHGDDAGRRYGEQTLGQLRRPDGTYPGVRIDDGPDFPTRGYMLDVSRDRVPTRATLEHLVARLAVCRYNELQLYIEHTYAHPQHRVVWADASPITPGDLEWLDDRCATVGIELVVNQNTFGHFGRWFADPDYRDRAECPDGFEIVPGVTLPPSVLAPTPDNAAFALALVRDQLAHVRSRSVNIGCDETFELGKGVSGDEVAIRGVGPVYLDHLRRIVDPLVADGCTVQFWGDVVRNHPALLGELPTAGCIPLVWNYDAPDLVSPTVPHELAAALADIGIDLDAPTDFTAILEPFAEAGIDHRVAPGTSTWQSFVGRLDNARSNLSDAAIAGRASGATGYLVTDWGDRGHHQPPAVSLPALVTGGALAWCGATNHDMESATVVDTRLVDDASGRFGGVLEVIGSLATVESSGVNARNASPLFCAVVPSVADLQSGDPDPDRLDEVIAVLESASNDLEHTRLGTADADALVDGVAVAIGLARHGAWTLRARGRAERLDPAAAAAELDGLVADYRDAWLATSRPGGLEDSVAPLEERRDRYRAQTD